MGWMDGIYLRQLGTLEHLAVLIKASFGDRRTYGQRKCGFVSVFVRPCLCLCPIGDRHPAEKIPNHTSSQKDCYWLLLHSISIICTWREHVIWRLVQYGNVGGAPSPHRLVVLICELMWNNHISNSFQCSWGMSLVVFHSKMPISVQSQKTVGRKIFTQAPSVALWQLSGMCHCLKWSIVGKILWSQFFLKNLKKYSPNLNHIFQFDFVTEVKYFVTHYLCANRWTYKKVRILNDICFGLWALSFEQLEKILFQKSEEHAYDPQCDCSQSPSYPTLIKLVCMRSKVRILCKWKCFDLVLFLGLHLI